ncbi:hypothetical protein DDN80_18890, partial [Vibrio cholerae]|nr:hypothetical protein [Vibrio cholerae]EGR2083524.1 hypothetical protein [Vibrio cholerae]EGR4407667.1 hypothetical protein [Vibrio cholerae]
VKGVNLRTIYYFIAIIVVPILAILFYAIFHQFSLSNNQIDWGAFGSFVGGVSAPVVAAITLVFLVNSNQEQARQTSLKVCIELVNDHATLVNNYKLPNVNSEYWTGRESLKELWRGLTNANIEDSRQFENRLKSCELELEPIVSHLKYIIHYISSDAYLSSDEKKKMVQLLMCRCERLELKLIKALTLRDEELKLLVLKHEFFPQMWLNPTEEKLFEYVQNKSS